MSGVFPMAAFQGLEALDTQALVIVVGVALLLLFSLLFALFLISRRQQSREVREMVVAVEELRSGDARRRAEIDPRSSLAVLADAVNRLAQDLSGRWNDAERAKEQLDAFLEAARDYGVVAANADWDIINFSQGATELFGWSEDEIVSRPASLLFHEASWKDLLPKLARKTLRERGVETRSVMTRREGKSFHGEVMVRQLRGSGEEAGYLLVVKDVTAQVRLESELRESETRYRSLVEGLSEGVVIVEDGLVAYANPAIGEILGVPSDALGGRQLREWVATRDLLLVEEGVRSVAGREGATERLRCTLTERSGEAVAHVRLELAGIKHGGKAATLVSVIDETVERRVERQLRLNEGRLDAVLEATSDAIVVLTDTAGGNAVNMTNGAFLSIFGLDRERVLGASEAELLEMLRRQGGEAASVAEFLRATEGADRGEAITLSDDLPRVLELKLAPLLGSDGQVLGRVLACRDLTEQKVVEQELERKIAELRSGREALQESYATLEAVRGDLGLRAEQLGRLNHELKKLDEMKSNLLANVSHELQTPLVSIRGYTEMILKGRLGAITEEQRKGLSLSLKNIDRLISMIDNLLTFSRMDREASDIKLTTFPLRSVVDESLEILQEKIRVKNLTVGQNLEEPEVAIRADRDKILQIFINLLSNAAKFNREGGTIEVVSRRGERGYLAVQIRDTGSGIPEDSLERIFERFYQEGATDTGPRSGSGIGLAIVRNILRLHGCTIRAESTVGEGSKFTFLLPLAHAEAAKPEPAVASPEPKAEAVSAAAPMAEPTAEQVAEPAAEPPREPVREPAGTAPTSEASAGDEPRPRFRIIRRPVR